MESVKYLGFDVHQSTISVAVVNADGKLVMQSVIATHVRDTSPLPAGSPGSVPRSSGSVDPATPEDRVVAGWPTEPAGMIPAARVRVPATTSSYSAGLRSGPPLATGS